MSPPLKAEEEGLAPGKRRPGRSSRARPIIEAARLRTSPPPLPPRHPPSRMQGLHRVHQSCATLRASAMLHIKLLRRNGDIMCMVPSSIPIQSPPDKESEELLTFSRFVACMWAQVANAIFMTDQELARTTFSSTTGSTFFDIPIVGGHEAVPPVRSAAPPPLTASVARISYPNLSLFCL